MPLFKQQTSAAAQQPPPSPSPTKAEEPSATAADAGEASGAAVATSHPSSNDNGTPRPSTEKPLPTRPNNFKSRLDRFSCLPTVKRHANRLSAAYNTSITTNRRPRESVAPQPPPKDTASGTRGSKVPPEPSEDERRVFKLYMSTRDALAKAEEDLEKQVAKVVKLREKKDELYERLVRSVSEGKKAGDEGWESRVPGIVEKLGGGAGRGQGEGEGSS